MSVIAGEWGMIEPIMVGPLCGQAFRSQRSVLSSMVSASDSWLGKAFPSEVGQDVPCGHSRL